MKPSSILAFCAKSPSGSTSVILTPNLVPNLSFSFEDKSSSLIPILPNAVDSSGSFFTKPSPH
jgi:hypothetical protein